MLVAQREKDAINNVRFGRSYLRPDGQMDVGDFKEYPQPL
jgi:hypothetical protein